MTVTKTEIRMGDVVELRNGETITVDSVFDSYGDQDGEYPGPWVREQKGRDRYLVADVARVITPNPRVCRFCGDGVTSTNPDCDYCRNCHYTGRAQEEEHADVLAFFRSKLPWARAVGIEHTGGGCFWLAVYGPEGSPYYWAMTDGEASIPDFAAGEGWGVVCRYAAEEHAREVLVDGVSWNELEGVPILEGASDPTGWFTPTLSHDEAMAAIAWDWHRLQGKSVDV